MSQENHEVYRTKTITGREIAALLNPRPVVLVTCCDAESRPNILTVAWHTPLSHEPPMLGISIGLTRYSHGLITGNGEFVINVVSRALQPATELCGNLSGRDSDKMALSELPLRPAWCVGPPLIAGALGWLECRVEQLVPTGDHTFFVARVLHAEVQEEAFTDAWHPSRGAVLLCWQRDRFGCGLSEEDETHE